VRALVVDDSSTIRAILCLYLKKMDIEPIEAADAREALVRLREALPDFLLVDWNMPEMDGIDLIRQIRKVPAYDALPVVMVTTNPESEHVGTAMDAGANEYIQKPCTLDMLRDKLDLLGLLKT
jgi:two-component system, chemotaxis family, chemotaxis protein CheY